LKLSRATDRYFEGFLGATATRIINEVKGVSRAIYDLTSKPIEWDFLF
jgi:GMP synthase PP-ATPase subunit